MCRLVAASGPVTLDTRPHEAPELLNISICGKSQELIKRHC